MIPDDEENKEDIAGRTDGDEQIISEKQSLDMAEELIDSLNLEEAQNVLDAVKEKSAKKYFLQSRIFAAKRWTKERIRQLEFALNIEPENSEYRAAMAEARKTEEALLTDEGYLGRAEIHIMHGDYEVAESALKCVKEKSAKKYYLLSKVYKSKNWFNEQRKMLKAAVKAEPDNETYKKELEELEAFRKTKEYKKMRQMGVGDAFASGCVELCCEGSVYCCCEGICEGLGNGC